MKSKLFQTFLLLINLNVIIFFGHVITCAQKNPSTLLDKRVTITFENVPLSKILEELMAYYDIPIGYEESSPQKGYRDYYFEVNPLPPNSTCHIKCWTENSDLTYSINARNETLENVLNKIVKQLPDYKWSLEEGVVNFTPVKRQEELLEILLNTRIEKFTMNKGGSIYSMRTSLLSLPEIKRFEEMSRHRMTIVMRGNDTRIKKIAENLDFSAVTFRELLNHITKVKKGGWIVRRGARQTDKDEDQIFIEI
jgi:hypothetical protein